MILMLVAMLTQAEVAEQTVTAQITDQVCIEKYDFTFHNPTGAQIEHDFILPIDPEAQATQFSMVMGKENVEARMVDKDRAAQIYQEIVRTKRDPGLLEHQGRGMIRARIFPIPPNGDTRVSLTLTRTLPSVRGTIRLSALHSMPGAKRIGHLRYTASITSQQKMGTVYCPTSITIQRKNDRETRVELDRTDYVAEKPLELVWSVGDGELGFTMLTHRLPGERGYFMLVINPRAEIREDELLAKEIVFCVDTSGSMQGEKMDQARKALDYCVSRLPERDFFTIVRFSDNVGMFNTELVQATSSNKKNAQDYISRLEAGGGTAIQPALQTSLAVFSKSDRPKILVFMTDGEPTIGETVPDRITERVRIENDKIGASIMVFGVGTDVKAPLLDKLAYDSHGQAEYVLPHEDLTQKLVTFSGKVQGPVMTDVAVRFDNTEVEEVYPRDVSTLYADQQIVLVGRYFSEGDRKVIVTGRQGKRGVKCEYTVSYPKAEGQNEFLERLWGGRKVGFLLGEIQRNGENPELVTEVKRLAKLHGIVTPYTSYLALEKEHRDRYFGSETARTIDLDKRVDDPAVYRAPDEDHNESPSDEAFQKAKGENLDDLSDMPMKGKAAYDRVAGGGGGGKYGGRFGGKRLLVARGGGSVETERAVLDALRWLARHQTEDGSISCKTCKTQGSVIENTALALNAFLGTGYTHLSKDTYDGICFGEVVKKALQYLMKAQVNDGSIGSSVREQILAAWSLCEAYGLTRSVMVRDPAQKAIDRLVGRLNSEQVGKDIDQALALLALQSAECAEVAFAADVRRKFESQPLYAILVKRQKTAVPVPADVSDPAVRFVTAQALFLSEGPSGKTWATFNENMKKAAIPNGCGSTLENVAWTAACLEVYYRMPSVFVDRQSGGKQASWNDKEKEFHASRDASNLARADKPSDLEDAGGTRKSIGTKTFAWVRGVWVDTAFDSKTEESKIRKVKFMSEEYDALIKADTELARYFSAGTDVVVVHKGQVYWVRE